MILATWRLMCATFRSGPARWGGVALVAGLLTVPAAGTALVLMDPYFTARSLSTPAAIFAVAAYLSGRWKAAAVWLLATAAIHPQMSVYVIALIAIMEAAQRFRPPRIAALAVLPAFLDFAPPEGPAREALLSRTYFFVNAWAWYEWIGAIAPLVLLAWFSRVNPRAALPAFGRISRALVALGVLGIVAGLLVISSPQLLSFTRLQPMRVFHPIYCIFFALLGGLAGEYVLRNKAWRWAALLVPLAAG